VVDVRERRPPRDGPNVVYEFGDEKVGPLEVALGDGPLAGAPGARGLARAPSHRAPAGGNYIGFRVVVCGS
jgi:hypothetical protein